MITEPGIYNMPSEEYHADPCPTPSLSAGMINDILVAPAKCLENSRRLNPAWEPPENQDKFTIGTVSHLIFLEPHLFDRAVSVLPFDDFRTNAAKSARDSAREDGRTPILEKHMVKVREARDTFFRHPFTQPAFADGKFEQSIFWRHPIYGFWCRARPDFMANSLTHLNDYKSTVNASPSNFGRHAYNLGYYRRAAWYLEGVEAVTMERPGHYWFCNQEPKSPYLTSIVELDMQALEAGQDENDYAAGIFARCLETSDWYGYRDRDHPNVDRAFRVGLPNYAYTQIDERLGRARDQWPTQRADHPEYEGVE